MKQHYTLVQIWDPGRRLLGEYFEEISIPYDLGADFSEELKKFGYNDPSVPQGILVKIYRVLLDEEELTAIKLANDDIKIIRNRPWLNIKNHIRRLFSW